MISLITIDEASAALDDEIYSEWDALEDPQKAIYINQASAWVRLNWTKSSSQFSWDDDTTWDDDSDTITFIKGLIAQYSDLVREGILYETGSKGVDSTAPLKRKTVKAGSVEQTLEYAQSETAASEKTSKAVDDQMLAIGFTVKYASNRLVRT